MLDSKNELSEKKNSQFVDAAPSNQNVLDIYANEWSSNVPGFTSLPGHAGLFEDSRIAWMDQVFQVRGSSVLELGPLEGAHSYMMNKMDARSITAVEANKRAFLKCLCIKEIFELANVQFLLGDFNKYLDVNKRRYDIIVASGVLYHMKEPIEVLARLVAASDRIFVWTHFYDEKIVPARVDAKLFSALSPIYHDGKCYYGASRAYPESAIEWAGFSGGATSHTTWLTLTSILDFFASAGFDVLTNFEQRDHPNGPAIALCATRRG